MRWRQRNGIVLSAEGGYADAQCNLGIAYAAGRGVPQDYTEAIKWLRLSAEQGDAVAQGNLGVIYANGQGIPQNYAEGMRWFNLAAEQGDAKAQYSIGVMYYNGEGVAQNYREAYVWFSLAAANGWEEATKPRDFLANRLPPPELLAAQREAAKRLAETRKKSDEKE